MEVGPEAKGRGLLNLGEHPGVGMEWGGVHRTCHRASASSALDCPTWPASSQGASVPLGVSSPCRKVLVSLRVLLTGWHPAGDEDAGDRKGGCRSLSLTLAGRDERPQVKACWAAGNIGKALGLHLEWNGASLGAQDRPLLAPAFLASLPLGSGPSTVWSAHPLLFLLQTLKPPQGREPPKAVSIFPSSWAAGTERARDGGGGRARAGVKLSTLHHKMALGSLREGPESTFAKVCSAA